MKVLGVGNALVDLLVCLESDYLIEVLKLPKGSMQLIDEHKYMKIINHVENYTRTTACGGSAANMVCGTAKLGVESGYVGKICNDSYGTFYAKDLLANGVRPQLFESELATGCATTFISLDGERTFGTYLGAAASMEEADLKQASFEGYDWIHIEGYLISVPSFFEQILKKAKAAGAKISIDLASYNIVRENLDRFKTLIPQYADLIFANEEEAYEYTGESPEKAVALIGKEVAIAVVKQGPRGSYICTNGTTIHASATKAKTRDTTGAGDLYAAGFFYGLDKGYSMAHCGSIGSIVAGNVIEVIGTKMDEPRWASIKQSIAELVQ